MVKLQELLRPRGRAGSAGRLAAAAAACAAATLAAADGGLAWPVPRALPPPGADRSAALVDSALARAERALTGREPELALRLYGQVPPGSGAAARVHYGEARCWLALGAVERAVEALRQTVALAETTGAGHELAAAAMELLGQTWLRLGRNDSARATFAELSRRWPDRRDWAAVMVGRTWQSEGAYRSAFEAIRPQLREGRCGTSYELALELYWKLDAGARRELDRLLSDCLRATGRALAGGDGQ